MIMSAVERLRRIAVFAVAALVASVCAGGEAGPPAGWHSGVGFSALAAAGAAGDEAAAEAKAKLNGAEAKIVFVAAAEPQVTPELLAGVAKHFPPGITYGCQVASPLIARTNFPDVPTIDIPAGVAVWALGGDMDIAVVSVDTDVEDDDSYFSAGKGLGEALRPAVEASGRPGRLIVTFGDQYNGANVDLAEGFNEGLGAVYPVVGAAAGNVTAKVIVEGAIRTGVNVAFLVAGDFRIGQAMNGGTHTPETAAKTLASAIAEGGGEDPFFALLFNCRRRRQGMIERRQLAEELDVIKRHLPGVDFFGFYGPGEIGAAAGGEPAKGVGFTIVAAVLFPL